LDRSGTPFGKEDSRVTGDHMSGFWLVLSISPAKESGQREDGVAFLRGSIKELKSALWCLLLSKWSHRGGKCENMKQKGEANGHI